MHSLRNVSSFLEYLSPFKRELYMFVCCNNLTLLKYVQHNIIHMYIFDSHWLVLNGHFQYAVEDSYESFCTTRSFHRMAVFWYMVYIPANMRWFCMADPVKMNWHAPLPYHDLMNATQHFFTFHLWLLKNKFAVIGTQKWEVYTYVHTSTYWQYYGFQLRKTPDCDGRQLCCF